MRNPDITDPRTEQGLNAANFAFFFLHRGYRIRSFLQEVYEPAHAEYMRGAGGVLLDSTTRSQSNEESARQSWLFRLDQNTLTPGSVLSFLFGAPPPRYFFTPVEQRLLEQALLGDTDAEVSRHLGVSADIVRMTWKSIYNRISQVSPLLVHDGAEQLLGKGRGTEKRRYVLEHIRNHLDELRPYRRSATRIAARG